MGRGHLSRSRFSQANLARAPSGGVSGGALCGNAATGGAESEESGEAVAYCSNPPAWAVYGPKRYHRQRKN